MVFQSDTIAAVATGLSSAGISIIRISGDDALKIADKIFVSAGKKAELRLSEVKSHTIHYGYIVDEGQVVDEVLVSVMKAPNTYTREDVIEINCHGGIIVTKKILETVIRHGARLAEPGEFTKRAFLNGRIDLSQAEAVIDVINAKNVMALKSAQMQLKGKVHECVTEIRKNILLDTAFIEAALDDPEHISLEGFKEKLNENTKKNLAEVQKLLDSSDNGIMMKEGIKTVILGKPNVGKSSILNILLGHDRAIVSDIEGTTRDTLEEYIQLDGITLNLIDTAGIRETSDYVEKIGVEKSLEKADEADLIIYVVDSSRPLDDNDYRILSIIKDRKALILLNKSDLSTVTGVEELLNHTDKKILSISAKENRGIDDLTDEIKKMFYMNEISFNDEVYITSLRHKEALNLAKESLIKVLESIEMDMPEDFYSIDLMSAYDVLGRIVGEEVDEDLVDTIFKEFCMGK